MRQFPNWQIRSLKLVIAYSLFALLATIANIGSQELAVRIYDGPWALLLSILVGTAVGLVVKYWLDKKYIFRFRSASLSHESRVFILYTLVGVGTTLVFWGFELLFHVLFETRPLQYLGGVIGLTIGYFLKYRFDKRFVFVPAS